MPNFSSTTIALVPQIPTRSDGHTGEAYVFDTELWTEGYHGGFPDDDAGIVIYQFQPWHGYELTDDGWTSVRGN